MINANYANFGHIPYGQSLIGTIYYDDKNPDMCGKSDPVDLKALEQEVVDEKTETFPTKIFIAKRG